MLLTVPQAMLRGLWSLGLLFGNVSDVLISYSHVMNFFFVLTKKSRIFVYPELETVHFSITRLWLLSLYQMSLIQPMYMIILGICITFESTLCFGLCLIQQYCCLYQTG